MEQQSRRMNLFIFCVFGVPLFLLFTGMAVYALHNQQWVTFVVGGLVAVVGLVLFVLQLMDIGTRPILIRLQKQRPFLQVQRPESVPIQLPRYRLARILSGVCIGVGLVLFLFALFLEEPIFIVTSLAIIGAEIVFLVVSLRHAE